MRDVPVLQPTKVLERFRVIRKEVKPRGRIAGDDDPPATDQVVHPVRLDAERYSELGDRQPSWHMAWTRAPVAVEAPMAQAEGLDRTREDLRTLRRAEAAGGQERRDLRIRFPLGLQGEHLRFHLCKAGQVVP